MPTKTSFIFIDERGFARQPSPGWRITFDGTRMFAKDERGNPLRICYGDKKLERSIELPIEEMAVDDRFFEETAAFVALEANLRFERVTPQSKHLFSPDDTQRLRAKDPPSWATYQLVPLS